MKIMKTLFNTTNVKYTTEYIDSVCRGIVHTDWYYRLTQIISIVSIIGSFRHLFRLEIGEWMWDLFVALLLFLSNNFKMFRLITDRNKK